MSTGKAGRSIQAVVAVAGFAFGIAGCGGASNSVAIHGSLAIERPDWDGLGATGRQCDGFAGSGYGDLSPGAAVFVYDPNHKVIGTGSLQPGQLVDLGKSDSKCIMRFTIQKLPKETFYGVRIANRPTIQFSAAQVAADEVALDAGGN